MKKKNYAFEIDSEQSEFILLCWRYKVRVSLFFDEWKLSLLFGNLMKTELICPVMHSAYCLAHLAEVKRSYIYTWQGFC